MLLNLAIPSFIAGLLTFLAPCTLPLVPGYLGFISGVSPRDLKEASGSARRKIFMNGVMYVVGFSAVFIVLGSLFGLGGAALFKYRVWLSRIGGVFVILFGLYMMHVFEIPFLASDRKLQPPKALKPGNPLSSLIFGATFAFGWSPCVGPILGSVLFLASTSATVAQGAFLLFIFSLGLAVPFLIIAIGIGSATQYIKKLEKFFRVFSFIGGVFLVFLGVLLLTNKLGVWIAFFFQAFSFLRYEQLLNYL